LPTFNTTFLVACFTVTLTVAFLPFAVLTVMVALPFPFATILPFLSTVATFLLEEDHVTVLSVVFVGFTVAFTVLDAPIEVKVTLLALSFTESAFTVETVTAIVAVLPFAVLAVTFAVPSAIA